MMGAQNSHTKKKKLLAYLALGLLCFFLAYTFRAEIGNMFHAASHILTGSDYSHAHEHPAESHNQIVPDQHDHKFLAFLLLLNRSEKMPIHSNKEQTIKLDLPQYAGMETDLINPAGNDKSSIYYGMRHWHNSLLLDVLTPPPKV